MRLSNYIYIKNFFSKEECEKVIKEGETNLKEATLIDNCIETQIRDTKVSFIRNGSPVQDLMEKIIDQIVVEAKHHYGCNLKRFEPMQYTKYTKGMFYTWHTDSAVKIEDLVKNLRDISASLILSPKEEHQGGSLQMILNGCISKDNVVCPKDVQDQEQGTLIIFPSNVLHQVTPIISGTRKSLVIWGSS